MSSSIRDEYILYRLEYYHFNQKLEKQWWEVSTTLRSKFTRPSWQMSTFLIHIIHIFCKLYTRSCGLHNIHVGTRNKSQECNLNNLVRLESGQFQLISSLIIGNATATQETQRQRQVDTGLLLAESNHVTWILASDWSLISQSCLEF